MVDVASLGGSEASHRCFCIYRCHSFLGQAPGCMLGDRVSTSRQSSPPLDTVPSPHLSCPGQSRPGAIVPSQAGWMQGSTPLGGRGAASVSPPALHRSIGRTLCTPGVSVGLLVHFLEHFLSALE